tara:strand:+ start:758 stop:1417 length:660 start_codon:yes stop_codon:yes gene_type:complete
MAIPSITKNETLGIEAVTNFNEKSYFLLFADIDSKDEDELLKVLKFYQKRHLSCYYYETTKGYHVASPVLLTFRTWLFRIRALRELVPQYSFGAIRISKRKTDSSKCYYQNWNDRKQKESFSFHALMSEIFFITNVKMVKPKKTKLNYIWYDQLNFKSSSIDSPKKVGAICFPTCRKIRLQNRDILCKGKQTFDSNLYNKWRSRMDDPMTYDECIEAQL